jgi:hypothetical protein
MRADYDVVFADQRRTVMMKADLAKGWRKLEKTYGFFRQMWIWYPGDFRVRTMLTPLAQPGTFDPSAAEFPEVSLDGGNDLTTYRIDQKLLTVRIALSEHQ